MSRSRLRKRLFRNLPALALVITLLVALLMVGGVQEQSNSATDRMLYESYLWVLLVTVAALGILLWTIVYRVITLVRNVRNEVPGARLAARWVRNFLALSIPPALIVFGFSAWFLSNTIDNWFDVRVETALSDSLELGQDFLGARTLEVRNQVRETASSLASLQEDGEALRQGLLSRVRVSGPTELSVMGTDGTLVATANINALSGPPDRPGDFAVLQVTQQGEYAAAEPMEDSGLQIRVLQLLPASFTGTTARYLQAIYPVPGDITALTGSIEQEYHRYQNASYLRQSLKQSFLLILSLVLLLTVLLAILAALNAARRMVSPLSSLSVATREVAGGDFGKQVAFTEKDEIGFLVGSFNEMTQALKSASQAAEESRAELQAQGEYLETVLTNLSSGVLTLDDHGRLLTANEACINILGLPSSPAKSGQTLNDLAAMAPFLKPLADTIEQQARRGGSSWQKEVPLERSGVPLVLLARGTTLPLPPEANNEPRDGYVVVFDDVTVLNQAQREAAWAEVARRLAHEVRNPLTPIRLAAERLQMKLADKLDESEKSVLNRASGTIVSQVEALRKLVDAFGDYASEPELHRESIRLDELVQEVLALYQQGDNRIEFKTELVEGPDGLSADSGRIRQLLHNVIRNAAEAAGDTPAFVTIRSRLIKQGPQPRLQIDIEDQGPGFPSKVLDKPFEPYASEKPRGSGLGLAICRKIVSEHDGQITISNPADGGALVRVELPLMQV